LANANGNIPKIQIAYGLTPARKLSTIPAETSELPRIQARISGPAGLMGSSDPDRTGERSGSL